MPHIYRKYIQRYLYARNSTNTNTNDIQGNIILIFKYSYSSLIEEIFEKGSLMLSLNKVLYWIFFMHKLYPDLLFFIKKY